MNQVIDQAMQLMNQGQNFVMASIIEQKGSAPRGTGTKMFITDTQIYGTIGGGAMEAQVIATARDQVLQTRKPVLLKFDLKPEKAAECGFLCGGECSILLYFLDGNQDETKRLFREWKRVIEEGKKAWVIYVWRDTPQEGQACQLLLSIQNEGLIGHFKGNEKVRENLIMNPIRVAIHGDTQTENQYYLEPLFSGGTIYLFGAGHVSKEVAALASNLDFNVIVFDDRAEFTNQDRFPGCEIQVLESFGRIPVMELSDESYVLIITRGHLHDKEVLAWALNQNPYYIGMIGSNTKRDGIYEDLKRQGVKKEALDRVFCPVGLNIGAQTPAEIGISILSQLILKRGERTYE